MSFFHGDGAMFDAFGHHEYFSRTQPDDPIAELNVDSTRQYQEEVVRVIVLMPHELPLHLDHHQVVAVELADHPGLPVF
jgi:hypothetical protein